MEMHERSSNAYVEDGADEYGSKTSMGAVIEDASLTEDLVENAEALENVVDWVERKFTMFSHDTSNNEENDEYVLGKSIDYKNGSIDFNSDHSDTTSDSSTMNEMELSAKDKDATHEMVRPLELLESAYCDNEENLVLWDVMTDHNYTSQHLQDPKWEFDDENCERAMIQQMLFKFKKKNIATVSNIMNLVDTFLESIEIKNGEAELCMQLTGTSQKLQKKEIESDRFLESIMDSVEAEDNAICDASSASLPGQSVQNVDKHDITDEPTNTQESDSKDNEDKPEKLGANDEEHSEDVPESIKPSTKEHMKSEVIDESTNGIETKNSKCHILEQIKTFSTKLNNAVHHLDQTENLTESLDVFLRTHFNEFRTLVREQSLFNDCEMQTEDLTDEKRQKLNIQNRIKLLESSDTESCSSSTSISSSSISSILSLSYESPEVLNIVNEIQENKSENGQAVKAVNGKIRLSSRDNDEDAVASAIDESAEKCKKDCESDKENSCTSLKFKRDDMNEDDKEIERLLNLNGLSKRQRSTSVPSNSDVERAKTKNSAIQKTQNKVLEFLEDHDIDSDTDTSICHNEEEEETITEKQYLARYNEKLKEQFLNASSSESDTSETDAITRLSDDEENCNSPLVDKFLKKFDIEANDDDDEEIGDNEDAKLCTGQGKDHEDNEKDIEKSESNSLDKAVREEEVPPEQPSNKSLDEKSDDVKNCDKSENSDCELLNNNILKKKNHKTKSLDKMLNDVDKRKKRMSKIDEDLISLSSDSESSDVEAVDLEANKIAKTRITKPMLRQDQLAGETREAQKREAERIKRLEKKHITLAKAIKEHHSTYKEGENNELILDFIESSKKFIKVHPDIVKHLKKHQIDGVKFMYDSCYGSVDSLKKKDGSGCILAHCMGLGKTLQMIALLHTVISYKELRTSKVLVLCPKSTVMNWAEEIMRWLDPLKTKNLKVFTFNDTSDIHEKLSLLKEWSMCTHQKAGCLLLGYEAYRSMVFYHKYKNRGNNPSYRLEQIREKVDEYLLSPGADLVVCDEGHVIKNSKSAISLAVTELKTPKRIVLTGTPIQNNLKEYYSMVNFIKPLFLGTEKEFANLYANPIKNGQHKDSSKKEIKIMQQRSFVLHKKLCKFVQRKEAELLKTFLPQKFEYVLFIPMTAVQNNLYEYILKAITKREENRGRGLITDYTCLRKIWTHPKVLEDAWKNANVMKTKKDSRKNSSPNSDDDQPDDIYDSRTGLMSVTHDWWRHLLSEKDLETILPSNKLRTMFEILRMCEEKEEKCLIFSAFVAVLNVVEFFFSKINKLDAETMAHLNISPNNNKLRNTWIQGKDYYRLDGKTPKSIRHEMITTFNSSENKRARVFLISSKAGGQGINLIGANRVIILDTSWNPSNDQQNIFRVFRLGQKRNCYIYRLLAMGTMEEKVYSRSVTKQAMSFRVVDEQQIDRHYSMAELAELYTLTMPDYKARPMPDFPQDFILASLLLNYPEMVYKYHEHDSLLENKVEQELSEQEKADAWAAYERDVQMSSEIPNLQNMENMLHMNLPSNKFSNYFGGLPGFDMQSLLNYNSFGQQPSTSSSFFNPMMSQFCYPQSTSQQYLDMLNMYSKYANPSAFMNLNKLDNSSYNLHNYGMNSGSSSMLPNIQHGSGVGSNASAMMNSNPLSALGDLSLFGLGGSVPKPATHSTHQSSHPSLFGDPLPQTHSSVPSSLPLMSAMEQYNLESQYRNYLMNKKDYIPPPPMHGSSLKNTGTSSAVLNPAAFQSNGATPPSLALTSAGNYGLADKSAPKSAPKSDLQNIPVDRKKNKKLPTNEQFKPATLQSADYQAQFNKSDSNKTMDLTASPRSPNVEASKDPKSSVSRLTPTFTPINLPYRPQPPPTTSTALSASSPTQKELTSPASNINGTSLSAVSNCPLPRGLSEVLKNEIQIISATTTQSNLQKQFNEPPNISLTAIETPSKAKSVPTNVAAATSKPDITPTISAVSLDKKSSGNTAQGIQNSSISIIPTTKAPTNAANSPNGSMQSNKLYATATSPNPIPLESQSAQKMGNRYYSTIREVIKDMVTKNKSPLPAESNKHHESSVKPPVTVPSAKNDASTSLLNTYLKDVRSSAGAPVSPTVNAIKLVRKDANQTSAVSSAKNISNVTPKPNAATSEQLKSNTSNPITKQNAHSHLSKLEGLKVAVKYKDSTMSLKNKMKPNTTKANITPIPPKLNTSGERSISQPSLITSLTKSNAAGTATTKVAPSGLLPKLNIQNPHHKKVYSRPSVLLQQPTPKQRVTQQQIALNTNPCATSLNKTLNIREINTNQNTIGKGVYIIEANINEKKLAIGAPTKSGGGTTITKVPLQRKRPSEEGTVVDNGVDIKRQKKT